MSHHYQHRENETNNSKYYCYIYIHRGGTRGFPLVAHQPTGWISGPQMLHQKSRFESPSKPSYLNKAL